MESRKWDVLGVGDADVDLFIEVNHLPGHDEKVLGTFLGEYPGGIVANFCCAASRFGARTALATVIGNDAYGTAVIAGLQEYGVGTELVCVRPDGKTYFCVVLLDSTGEKALTVVQTDCMFPSPEDLDVESFWEARLVHLTGSDLGNASWFTAEAKRRGAQVSLDIEPTTVGDGIGSIKQLLSHVDVAFPNEAGLDYLFPGDPIEGALALSAMGPRTVVVTRGAKGCLIAAEGQVLEIPAFAVPVVDTTGAGDCFNGAFISCYLAGRDLGSCGRFASAAAALSVAKVGSRTGLPSVSELEAFLAVRSEM